MHNMAAAVRKIIVFFNILEKIVFFNILVCAVISVNDYPTAGYLYSLPPC